MVYEVIDMMWDVDPAIIVPIVMITIGQERTPTNASEGSRWAVPLFGILTSFFFIFLLIKIFTNVSYKYLNEIKYFIEIKKGNNF